MSPTETIKQFLDEQDSKIQLMKHWITKQIERREVAPEHYSDGPYPPMEKLIALCRELLNNMEEFSQVIGCTVGGYYSCGNECNKEADKALSRAAEIVGENEPKIEVVADDTIPKDEVHFVSPDGKVVGKIKGIFIKESK